MSTLLFASDDVDWVSWSLTEEEIIPVLRHTNAVIVTYVTTESVLVSPLVEGQLIFWAIDSFFYIQKCEDSLAVKWVMDWAICKRNGARQVQRGVRVWWSQELRLQDGESAVSERKTV